eukprot:TRINITY_DN4558_c0_g1_i1.p1 TRINITY_DN4558_c0_g1~~TRINITY_DN4558_c0_g1_i1.p1  ORF type:complete len:198 (-),score=25.76 TRINITY_DN4558_c0_g1_i1:116-709(-)
MGNKHCIHLTNEAGVTAYIMAWPLSWRERKITDVFEDAYGLERDIRKYSGRGLFKPLLLQDLTLSFESITDLTPEFAHMQRPFYLALIELMKQKGCKADWGFKFRVDEAGGSCPFSMNDEAWNALKNVSGDVEIVVCIPSDTEILWCRFETASDISWVIRTDPLQINRVKYGTLIQPDPDHAARAFGTKSIPAEQAQ